MADKNTIEVPRILRLTVHQISAMTMKTMRTEGHHDEELDRQIPPYCFINLETHDTDLEEGSIVFATKPGTNSPNELQYRRSNGFAYYGVNNWGVIENL